VTGVLSSQQGRLIGRRAAQIESGEQRSWNCKDGRSNAAQSVPCGRRVRPASRYTYFIALGPRCALLNRPEERNSLRLVGGHASGRSDYRSERNDARA
jgi:hypothetical protein